MNFLSIKDTTKEQFLSILEIAAKLKQEVKAGEANAPVLANNTAVMVFTKPSLRTRLSFEVGVKQLGGNTVYLGADDIGLGAREPTKDIARVLGSMGDLIIGRVYQHETLECFAQESGVPVINALSDREHPCQILADMLTIQECRGSLEDFSMAYVGDGDNNVCHSLILAAQMLGFDLRIASPEKYQPNKEFVTDSDVVTITTDPREAVEGVDVVYTDTWVSMGCEEEKEERVHEFRGYTVTQELMSLASPDVFFMHDMPAYRGYEVTEEVIDGQQSVIYQQAENRLHAQKGLMRLLTEISS